MRVAVITLLITTLVIAATASRTAARPTASACGSDYWLLKTFSDLLRKKVNLTPKDTTLSAIASPAHPHPTPTTRNTPFELQVWRVTVQITEFKREGDSDIHLILFDAGTYGIAEMPAAACVPKKARARKSDHQRAQKVRGRLWESHELLETARRRRDDQRARLLGQAAHTEPSRPELRGAAPGHGDQVHCRLPRLEPPRLPGPLSS
jgi:hypothetical protein